MVVVTLFVEFFMGYQLLKTAFDLVHNKKVMNFFLRSSLSKLQAIVLRYSNRLSKDGYRHENQREKLNKICENQPDSRIPVYTEFDLYWHSLLNLSYTHRQYFWTYIIFTSLCIILTSFKLDEFKDTNSFLMNRSGRSMFFYRFQSFSKKNEWIYLA